MTPMEQLQQLKQAYLTGWNTWENNSVLSHLLLPQGVLLRVGLYHKKSQKYHMFWFVDKQGIDVSYTIHPYAHAFDGSYTQLTVEWEGLHLVMESSAQGEDLVLRLLPSGNTEEFLLLVQADRLPGYEIAIESDGEKLQVASGEWHTEFAVTAPVVEFDVGECHTLCTELTAPVGIFAGKERTLEEISAQVEHFRARWEENKAKYGDCAELYNAMQTCLAWDTIYYPPEKDVFSPVARSWSRDWGGYVLFDWDTFFASNMCAIDCKELAYLNLYAIASRATPQGFVPNFATPGGNSTFSCDSLDRSQPPVGSSVALRIFEKYREPWILELVYPYLKRWNQWFYEHRQTKNGLLTWGSDPFRMPDGSKPSDPSVGTWQGAAFESGLDNSPMYDEAVYDEATHRFLLDDAGLNGLYIEDCRALAEIAEVLGKSVDAEFLRERQAQFEDKLEELWDEEAGMYCNRHTDTGKFSHRYSPTNFYTLFSRKVSPERVKRMLEEHFYNPEEFFGEYMLPSIARNDPAYADQTYWRGRVWAPMNFLVYLALDCQNCSQAKKDLAEKSAPLLMKEWLDEGHVHENYNADTGDGDDVGSSNQFYHWGALLSLIQLMEQGYF